MLIVDKALSQRLEGCEARSNASFTESRARLEPEIGATWTEFDGTFAMFDGAESPCTQTFGLGLFSPPTAAQLDEIEAFFRERDGPVFHEVSPMADPSLLPLLNARGYQPIELSSVLYRELDGRSPDPAIARSEITTRIIEPDEVDLWARTSAAGWATEHESLGDFMFDFGRASAQCAGSFPFIAELGTKAVATGMMFIRDDVAMLAGASTIPDARQKGAQSALLHARLSHAAALGSSIACMAASPGSRSQRNAEKNGFLIAYTRTKWQLID